MRLDIRAMSFGEVLDAALKVYREHAVLLFGLGLAYAVPMRLLSVVLGIGTPPVKGSPRHVLPILILALVQIVGWSFITAVATAVVAQVVEGKPATYADCMARMRGRWGSYIGATLIFLTLTFLGFIALAVPGIIYYCRRALWTPVLVFEGGTADSSLKRSKKLIGPFATRRADKVIGIALIMVIVQYALSTAFNMVLPASIAGFAIALPQAACIPITSLVLAFIYVDARVRDEGYDLALRTGVDAQSSVA